MLTIKEVAFKLHGRQYRDEIPKGYLEQLKSSGIIVGYGRSDDILILDGAMEDEIYPGSGEYLRRSGVVHSRCESSRCPYHAFEVEGAIELTETTGKEGREFDLEIPHESFAIFDGAWIYCRGIAFREEDLPK